MLYIALLLKHRRFMEALTKKQNEVYDFISGYIEENQMSPTIGEIQKHFNYKSPKAVVDFLTILERKEWIKRSSSKSRSIVLLNQEEEKSTNNFEGVKELVKIGDGDSQNPFSIFFNPQGNIKVDESYFDTDNCFVGLVQENGMQKEGIHKGDLIIIQQKLVFDDYSVVAALMGKQFIVRKYRNTKDGFELYSENKRFPRIKSDNNDKGVSVIGEVVGLMRNKIKPSK